MKTELSEKTFTPPYNIYQSEERLDVEAICFHFIKANPALHKKAEARRRKEASHSLGYHKGYYKKNKEKLDAYRLRYRHNMQDEAGCHLDIKNFIPAYRFLEALQTAEVVEIDGRGKKRVRVEV